MDGKKKFSCSLCLNATATVREENQGRSGAMADAQKERQEITAWHPLQTAANCLAGIGPLLCRRWGFSVWCSPRSWREKWTEVRAGHAMGCIRTAVACGR